MKNKFKSKGDQQILQDFKRENKKLRAEIEKKNELIADYEWQLVCAKLNLAACQI